MPSMDGAELLDKVKEINSDVKRILISAFEINDDVFKDCHSIDEFLSKLIIMSKLIEVVQHLLTSLTSNGCEP